MGKTYRKDVSERSKKKKKQKHIWKKFQIRNELKEVVQDYENNEEVSELSDENIKADS
jgi:hypothetical protein